jgi:colanic acid/amylovoran biosynthesis glycosyltransferase
VVAERLMSLRCAYLVARHPAITQTFVYHEIRALRGLGAEVLTASVRRSDPGEALSPDAERERRETYALLPTSVPRLLRAHARAFGQAPLAYLQTLASALWMGPAGARNRLWQLFYFAETMLLWEWLVRQDVRHVHVHFANVASDVAMLCASFGNRADPGGARWSWSLTVHGPTELLDMQAHKLARKVRAADAVICTSDFVRSQLLSLVPEPGGTHLVTLRCGVDRTIFHPPAEPPDGTPVEILNVAGMSARKGHRVLLDALAELDRRGVDFHAKLVGDGPERAALEEHVGNLGLDDRVTFMGALGEHVVPGLYRRADIFCLPSFAEGVPTVLMEAMASELPVVTTHIMGVPELVRDGHSGLVIPPARSDALADALEALAGDPELRRKLGRAARERVESEYDLHRSAVQLARLLGSLAAR